MRALALEGEERAFEVAAEDVGAGCHLLAHGADVAADHVHGVGDQREHLARGAMHGVAGPRHVDAVRPVIEALLPCAVRVDVHVAGGQNTAFGVDDRVAIGRVEPHRAAAVLEGPLPRAGRHDDAGGIGDDPISAPFAARIHLARVTNRHRSRLALQCRGHARDYLVPIRHVVLLTAHALPLAGASTR